MVIYLDFYNTILPREFNRMANIRVIWVSLVLLQDFSHFVMKTWLVLQHVASVITQFLGPWGL